jgi:hypothetical protein
LGDLIALLLNIAENRQAAVRVPAGSRIRLNDRFTNPARGHVRERIWIPKPFRTRQWAESATPRGFGSPSLPNGGKLMTGSLGK